jgi:ABC-type Fe3+-hydroxamate transport system substrate-binding protein
MAGQTKKESAEEKLARLEKENEELKAQVAERSGGGPLSLKLSPKGGISAYGLGRFPTTLYVEQWLKILDNADQIREFIKANDAKLKRKGQ